MKVASVVMCALAVGCGGSAQRAQPLPDVVESTTPPKPLPITAPLLHPGEHMEWEVTWKGLTGGRAQLVTGQPGNLPDGRRAVIVRSQSHADGLIAVVKNIRDELTTTVDLSTSLPIETTGDFEFGQRRSAVRAWFTETGYHIEYERAGANPLRWEQTLPPGTAAYNTHAALGALRAWHAAAGERVFFYALSGRRLYRIDLTYRGTETIRTALGDQPAVRMDGVGTRLHRSLKPSSRKPRQFTVWFSDDDLRIPLRVEALTEYGDVRVDITGYTR